MFPAHHLLLHFLPSLENGGETWEAVCELYLNPVTICLIALVM